MAIKDILRGLQDTRIYRAKVHELRQTIEEMKLAQAQLTKDITTAGGWEAHEEEKKYSGNEYRSYAKAIEALDLKYNALSN